MRPGPSDHHGALDWRRVHGDQWVSNGSLAHVIPARRGGWTYSLARLDGDRWVGWNDPPHRMSWSTPAEARAEAERALQCATCILARLRAPCAPKPPPASPVARVADALWRWAGRS